MSLKGIWQSFISCLESPVIFLIPTWALAFADPSDVILQFIALIVLPLFVLYMDVTNTQFYKEMRDINFDILKQWDEDIDNLKQMYIDNCEKKHQQEENSTHRVEVVEIKKEVHPNADALSNE